MKIIKLNNNYVVAEASKLLLNGKIIVCPTDTVYGLLCDATNKKAVDLVFKIKGRNKTKPLPIFVKDIKMAKNLAYITKQQEKILKEKWPGRVTFVLLAKNISLPSELYHKKDNKLTIGLRQPNYELVQKLMAKTKKPLVGTSANISGQPPCYNIKCVVAQFKNKKFQPDLLIVAPKNLPKQKPSKVIDITEKIPKILRA